MSNWLVAIVGGAIATIVGGLVLFYILPSQQAPGLAPPSIAPAPSVVTGLRHLKCSMTGGVMNGEVYTFSIDTAKKRAEWADYAIALNVTHLEEHRVHGRVEMRLPGKPEHDYVVFNFSRLTLAVDGLLVRRPTAEEVAKCRGQAKGPWSDNCGLHLVVGEVSHGTCEAIARAF